MPRWIWTLHAKILTAREKHFLCYLWWCGPHGAHSWNYRLEKMFDCSRSTIQRRLRKLKKLHLIHIGHPCDRGRTIWASPYYKIEVWLLKSGVVKSSARVSKMTPINNAQHDYYYTDNNNRAVRDKGVAKKTCDNSFTVSDADGLCGSARESRDHSDAEPEQLGDLLKATEELAKIKLQATLNNRRRKRERKLE